jgi:acyl-CoA reductase-like NAD-dependent aldehyde dehydrogenase
LEDTGEVDAAWDAPAFPGEQDYSDGVRLSSNEAQRAWAEKAVAERLRVIRRARSLMAARSQEFFQAISPELSRTGADTLAAELMPLLAAARFLEQRAGEILRAKKLGRRGLPFWLSGVESEVQRAPFGRVLVIAPSNYPLFLPGVQILQGLVAGNSVVWKPGRGGGPVAQVFADVMRQAGLPEGLLRVTDESVEAAEVEIAAGVDKVFFTGSATTGRALLARLAETLTPCVAELSGCDAVVVLPSADLSVVVGAVTFGMRLNGSATCMAPRRLLLVDAPEERRVELIASLEREFANVPGVAVSNLVRRQLPQLIGDAKARGATVSGESGGETMKPLLILNATPAMDIADADIFAPVLAVITVDGVEEVLKAQESCRFALTVSIFGEEREARTLADRMTVGSVLINDIIVPTADPRLPFGGRKESGFGVTRGTEGLLEMTAVKAIAVRRNKTTRHYEATTEAHGELFKGTILASNANGWRARLQGLRRAVAAGRNMKSKGGD